MTTLGFHGLRDRKQLAGGASAATPGVKLIAARRITTQERTLSYRFYAHFHPFVGELVERLGRQALAGLQAADTEYTTQLLKRPDGTPETTPSGRPKMRPVLYKEFFSAYGPSGLVARPYPVKSLDFSPDGPYAVYNWELFYHVPLAVAMHLSKNQRFDEAQRWFHFVFDPTDDSDGPTPERFWKVKPLQDTDVKLIEEVLVNLSTRADPELRRQTLNSIGAWKDAPFRPHAVARHRHSAYMFKAVMAYLDNLIDWGDSLFRQDTGESINEATQLYVLAANILGPRPQAVPKKGSVRPQTYANLRADLDEFGNALRELETDIPFDTAPPPPPTSGSERLDTLGSIGHSLYFGVPRNDKLVGYWDVVADRLFKIRNSLNLQGTFRQLPLFEPPIDPALLARAAAAGLDIGAVVSGANQPLPLVRFAVLVQKAAEACHEVKALGSALLSAIEKEDNEALAVLRARHERVVLGLAETVKYGQWQEAIKNREGIEQSIANAAERLFTYERLLGKNEGEVSLPELDDLDRAALERMGFRSAEPSVEPHHEHLARAATPGLLPAILPGLPINMWEQMELVLLEDANLMQGMTTALDAGAAVMNLIPLFQGRITPWGIGAGATTGGQMYAAALSSMSAAVRDASGLVTHRANTAAKVGSYVRRAQEWEHQSNMAAGEITLLFKQLRAAQIREAVAELELKSHRQQVRNAEEVEGFLTEGRGGKTANQGFYAWQRREVKGLYAQCFQFAFDLARKAERALQHELGDPELSFIQFGYLAGREGLLAGEKLHFDVRRMEAAYQDLNRREYELTKHVSLQQVNPAALLQLRAAGRCTVFLPEELFDLDCPGHYFRRIKTVTLSVPSVTGPYVGVNCKLTLLKSSVRKSPLLSDGAYAREGAEDARFSDHFGSMQSIVTSTGQNDGGLFDPSLRDERYLPFEGSGVVSEWQLELPDDVRQFSYDTITDVVLHLRYTAREGGDLLRKAASDNLRARIDEGQAAGSVRLFSARHEFPTAWAKFKNARPAPGSPAGLKLTLGEEHYPFWGRDMTKAVKRVGLFARTAVAALKVYASPDGTGGEDTLNRDPQLKGYCSGRLNNVPLPPPTGELALHFDDNSMDDIWIALSWGKAS